MSSILFVSHDGDLRAVASRVLRKAGWEVTAVAHGGHALLACVEGRTFDVLVVDQQTHDDAGGRLARQLRRYCPGLEVVCLRDGHGRMPGASIAVVRPFTADDLIEAVRAAAMGVASR
jgi:CheY-like chemotaxis protein